MSLKTINAAIQKIDALVELVRGDGYHYYVFDNSIGPKMHPDSFTVGTEMIFESESVMVPYTNSCPDTRWIEDGIDFGKRTRIKWELPEA